MIEIVNISQSIPGRVRGMRQPGRAREYRLATIRVRGRGEFVVKIPATNLAARTKWRPGQIQDYIQRHLEALLRGARLLPGPDTKLTPAVDVVDTPTRAAVKKLLEAVNETRALTMDPETGKPLRPVSYESLQQAMKSEVDAVRRKLPDAAITDQREAELHEIG